MAVRVTKNTLTVSLSKIDKRLKGLPATAYKFFKRATPIKSGNARRRTRLNQSTIQAMYPYAKRLNEGYSKQAPDGMVKPTIEYIKRYIAAFLRKKG